MIRMKRKDKEAWLKALREETYPKGIGALKDFDGGYCCIGVLQMVLDGKVETDCCGDPRGMPTKNWWVEKGVSTLTGFNMEHGLEILEGLPYFEGGKNAAKYIPDINDNCGLTFPQMADILDPIIEVYDEA